VPVSPALIQKGDLSGSPFSFAAFAMQSSHALEICFLKEQADR
jgi:hypothetical protein